LHGDRLLHYRCTAATLYKNGHRTFSDAAQAAHALYSLARKGAEFYSLLGCSTLALRRFHFAAFHRARDLRGAWVWKRDWTTNSKRPPFSTGCTRFCRGWAGVVLLPNAPLWKILIFSQVGNGIWLPVVVIFILLLVNRRDLMGDYVNTVTFNIVAWVTAIAMIGLTLVLTYTALFRKRATAALMINTATDVRDHRSVCYFAS